MVIYKLPLANYHCSKHATSYIIILLKSLFILNISSIILYYYFCNYVFYSPCNHLLIIHYFHCRQVCFVNIVSRVDYEHIKFNFMVNILLCQSETMAILSFLEYYLNDFCIPTCFFHIN